MTREYLAKMLDRLGSEITPDAKVVVRDKDGKDHEIRNLDFDPNSKVIRLHV